jgi:hypothetical protein
LRSPLAHVYDTRRYVNGVLHAYKEASLEHTEAKA